MLFNVNITRLYEIVEVIKTGSRMALNNITLSQPMICYSIYHKTLSLAGCVKT